MFWVFVLRFFFRVWFVGCVSAESLASVGTGCDVGAAGVRESAVGMKSVASAIEVSLFPGASSANGAVCISELIGRECGSATSGLLPSGSADWSDMGSSGVFGIIAGCKWWSGVLS